MKKALSIILALILAFSLLPTFAFAAETTEAETTETAVPTTFTIDFSDYTTPQNGTIATQTKIGPNETVTEFKGENWEALLDEENSEIYSGTGYLQYRIINAGTAEEDAYLFFDITKATEDGENRHFNTFSLTFNVSVSGVYDISSLVWNGKHGGYTKMYIDGESVGTIENSTKGNVSGDNSNDGGGLKTCYFGKGVALSAGTHTMKLEFTVHEKPETAGRLNNIFCDFTFSPSTVTTVDSVELSKTNYEIGETFLPGASFTAGGQTVSDPEGNSVVAVELTSSNEKVVKCSDSAFIALDEGTAELTAKISVNGTESEVVNLGAVTVSPAAVAKDFTLDFAKRLSTVDDLYFHTDNGYYYFWYTTNKFYGSNWVGSAEKDESTLLNSPRRVNVKDAYISMTPNATDLADGKDTLLFYIYAPADGVYDVTSDLYFGSNGGYLKLYIDDMYIGENCLNKAAHNGAVAKNTVAYKKGIPLTAGEHILKLVNSSYTADGSVTNGFYSITFSVSDDPEAESLTAFTPDNTENITSSYTVPTVSGLTTNGAVNPEANGDGTYKITADEEKDGAKFLYWAKGLTTQKKIISFSNVIENYVPEEDGRNLLIAVYEGEESQADEFYNANGQLIPGATLETTISMPGYGTSNGWNRYGETSIYVANYDLAAPKKNIAITVKNGDGTGIYAYGDTVTCTATNEGFKFWKKNNEIVSCDETYTFKAWESCTVEAFYGDYAYNGEKKKIIIDRFNAGNEIGIMAEFIGFGSNVVEKGIMWNNNKIAMTKPGTQFSVVADKNGEYKGYAIVGNEQDGYTLITDGSVTVSVVE